MLEGRRLIEDALGAGMVFQLLLVLEDDETAANWAERAGPGCEVRRVTEAVMAKASALDKAPGLLGLLATPRARGLEEARLIGGEPLVLVVAGIAQPGNLGALARSAEAAGAEALVVVAGGASPWNPKALRGSMGSLLRLPLYFAESARQAAEGLAGLGLRQAMAATRGGASLREFDWSGPMALWISGETGAAPDTGRDLEAVTIPMLGGVESLNVTVAGSLLLFAAGRAEGGPG